MEAPIVSMRDVTIETDGGVRLVHVDELDIFRGDTIAITGRRVDSIGCRNTLSMEV
ncbi:hypothetical protein [Corynebacterium diphtheriae]